MVGGKKGGLPVTVGLNVGLFVGLNVTGLKFLTIFLVAYFSLISKCSKYSVFQQVLDTI